MTLQLANESDVIITHEFITQGRICTPINWKSKAPGMDDMKCQNYKSIHLACRTMNDNCHGSKNNISENYTTKTEKLWIPSIHL